mgnify:CR=1 FL=1
MKKIAIVVSLSALAVSGVAVAQSQTDGVTRADVTAKTDQAFARMDINDDGVVDQQDRQARMLQHFARIDADGNGAISQAEFLAMHENRAQHRNEGQAERGERRGGKHMGRRGGRGDMARTADANQDGTITAAEFRAAALTRFEAIDADSDGTVTREERRASMKAMRDARRAQ